MKTQYKFFSICIILILTLCGFYIWKSTLNSSDKNLENEKAEMVISANDLVNGYTSNEKKSNNLYAGKIVEVYGTIKEINFLNDRTTIILKTNSESFGVICDINPSQKTKINQLKEHQNITIKGICKGYLKDVILLNCTIDLSTNE